jgi:hypothetical protein
MRVKALVTTMTVAALLALAPGSALARTSVAGDPGVSCGRSDCSTTAAKTRVSIAIAVHATADDSTRIDRSHGDDGQEMAGEARAKTDKKTDKMNAELKESAAKVDAAVKAAIAQTLANVEAKVGTVEADDDEDVDEHENADLEAKDQAQLGSQTASSTTPARMTTTGGAATTETASADGGTVAGFESAPVGSAAPGASSTAVLGIETLPSTSSAPAPLGLLGLAFIAAGGLLLRRSDRPKI